MVKLKLMHWKDKPKRTEGKEPKKRHKKNIQTQRPSYSHTQESHKNTKLEVIIPMEIYMYRIKREKKYK